MKKSTTLLLTLLWVSLAFGQTQLAAKNTLGPVKIWTVRSASGQTLGTAYSIEPSAKAELKFSPTPEDLAGYLLVMTGTYTSPDGMVAGNAFNGSCEQVGNTDDPFQPNSYLFFAKGSVRFLSSATCSAIGVYKVVDDSVLQSVVSERTKKPFAWRFLVEKSWTKTYLENGSSSGRDLMIIDFDRSMTLLDACKHVQALGRKACSYYDAALNENFTLSSKITAALLDTGTYRPFLLEGQEVYGKFPDRQSNVIAIR